MIMFTINNKVIASLLICLSLSTCLYTQFSDTAKVNIGTAANDTQTLYSFNFNLASSSLVIPVYLTDVSLTNATSIAVTCGLSTGSLSGYSHATFLPRFIPISLGYGSGTVSFSSPSVGRATGIQCWATAPSTLTKANTISSPKGFVISPAGTVNVFFPVTVVGSPLWIKLSAPAEGNSVLVNCSSNALSSFPTQTFTVGQQIKAVTVTYNLNANTSTVRCSGQSQNGGLQFLYSSSLGVSGTIQQFVPVAKLVPSVSMVVSQSSSPQIQIFLVINGMSSSAASSRAAFTCSVYQVSSVEAATNITAPVTCPTIPSTTTPAAGVTGATTSATPTTGQWTLDGQGTCLSYTIAVGLSFLPIVLTRGSGVSVYSTELVYVQCRGSSGEYANQSPSLLTEVQLYPYTSGSGTSSSNGTLTLPNPAYVNIAPCPCNLLQDSCDLNCCCDSDCTQSDITTFSCHQGFFGGFDNVTSQEFCNSTYFYQPDWFPIMCICIESNGFLGYFYYLPVSSPLSTTQAISSYSSSYSYVSQQPVAPGEPGGSSVGYVQGLAIKTGLQTTQTTNVDQVQLYGTNYLLTLPLISLEGQCSWFAPVRFLNDSLSTCQVKVTSATCGTNLQLNAVMYAQSLRWGTSTGPLVLNEQASPVIAFTNVNYLCPTTSTSYVKSTETYAEAVPPNTVSCFASNDSCTVGNCEYNSSTGAYTCPDDPITWVSDYSVPPRCSSFDSGFKSPPAPSYNSTSLMCDNVVVQVLYNFTWSNQTVVLLNATVLLASIPITSSSIEVTQRFEVVFNGVPASISINTSTTNATDAYYPPSGNPGYDKLLPVISGVLVNDSSIDATSSNRLSLFKPDSTGLCSQSGRKNILFGVNEISSCQLRLDYNNFLDCSNIQKLVANALDSLMPSNYISIVGNPMLNNLTDWVNIIRQDLSSIFANSTNANASSETTTRSSVTTAAQGTAGVTATTAASVTAAPSGYSYLDDLTGICRNIPTSIYVDILYAQAGLSNYHPIYNIVGARISYTLSTWKLNCIGSGSTACVNSSVAQSFLVSSSANFVLVPPVTPPATTVYEAQTYVPPYICYQGTCWSEFFYPFSNLNPGESQQATLAVALFFSMFIIFLVGITRPSVDVL